MVSTRVIQPHEFDKISAFYQENDYSPILEPDDTFLVAEEGAEIRAALRLCRENGCLVLRGMRVTSQFQRRGIGSELLRFARDQIGDEPCYCLPHSYLRDFYAQIGFEQISSEEAPKFLASRLNRYQREYRLDVIMMCKPGLRLQTDR